MLGALPCLLVDKRQLGYVQNWHRGLLEEERGKIPAVEWATGKPASQLKRCWGHLECASKAHKKRVSSCVFVPAVQVQKKQKPSAGLWTGSNANGLA